MHACFERSSRVSKGSLPLDQVTIPMSDSTRRIAGVMETLPALVFLHLGFANGEGIAVAAASAQPIIVQLIEELDAFSDDEIRGVMTGDIPRMMPAIELRNRLVETARSVLEPLRKTPPDSPSRHDGTRQNCVDLAHSPGSVRL